MDLDWWTMGLVDGFFDHGGHGICGTGLMERNPYSSKQRPFTFNL